MIIGHAIRNKEGCKEPTRKFSERQEKSVAKAINGQRTINSGATDFGGKSDVLNKDWAIECKTKVTDCNSISIKRSWIDKLKAEALFDGKKYNAIAFSFGPTSPNYYIIDEFLFQQLVKLVKESE